MPIGMPKSAEMMVQTNMTAKVCIAGSKWSTKAKNERQNALNSTTEIERVENHTASKIMAMIKNQGAVINR